MTHAATSHAELVVASHNLMSGWRVEELCRYYRALRRSVGLDVLCLQENRHGRGESMVARVERGLGDEFDHVGDDHMSGVSIAYDRARLRLLRSAEFALPAHRRMSWLERNVVLDDRPEQISAQFVVFEREGGEPFTVVNFHLDTVGGTRHRRSQVRAIVDRLDDEQLCRRVVACGDTNAFALGGQRQLGVLDRVLEPLSAIGALQHGTEPTHFFSRQDEPRLVHRVAVALGRIGIDVPNRFDVVCTNLPVSRHGQVTTRESDHDLVWAAVVDRPS